MNNILTTNTYFGTLPITSPTPPTPSITMPEPTSYEFQVVEHIDDGKITKVALQVRRHTHDQYGNIKMHGTWEDVPRVQITG